MSLQMPKMLTNKYISILLYYQNSFGRITDKRVHQGNGLNIFEIISSSAWLAR